MPGPMPTDELRSHRRIIVEFLADWGYHLAPGAILPAQFKHSYGLKIDMGKAWTISNYPGKDGQTSEYFLRDCLDTAHLNLWRELRDMAITQQAINGDKDDLRHCDGHAIARWAAFLRADDSKPFSGKFDEDSMDSRIERRYFSGTISGSDGSLQIDNRTIKVKTIIPESLLEGLKMKTLGEVFEDLPQCMDAQANADLADSYIMSVKQEGAWAVFDVLGCRAKPMPGANPNDLWRRVRDAAPDTVMLQFPPHVDASATLARAAEHRAMLEVLLAEVNDNDQSHFFVHPRKAAA